MHFYRVGSNFRKLQQCAWLERWPVWKWITAWKLQNSTDHGALIAWRDIGSLTAGESEASVSIREEQLLCKEVVESKEWVFRVGPESWWDYKPNPVSNDLEWKHFYLFMGLPTVFTTLEPLWYYNHKDQCVLLSMYVQNEGMIVKRKEKKVWFS